jgi:hypothetical protein
MDMKKILGIVTGAKENTTTQLNENVEECGMPGAMSSSMPSSPPVSMSVNLNAQGVDNIKELLNLMRTADAPKMGGMMPEPMDMPAVGMDMPIKVTKIGGDMDDKPKSMPDNGGDRGMAQIRDLISKADKPEEAYANEPDEKYADISASIPSGDDLHKQKSMHRATAGGDNPMAVRAESIRQALDQRYKEIKEGKLDEFDVKLYQPADAEFNRGFGADISQNDDVKKIIATMKPQDYIETNKFLKDYPRPEDYKEKNQWMDVWRGRQHQDMYNFVQKYNRDNNNLSIAQWLQKAKNKISSAVTGKPEQKVSYKAARFNPNAKYYGRDEHNDEVDAPAAAPVSPLMKDYKNSTQR